MLQLTKRIFKLVAIFLLTGCTLNGPSGMDNKTQAEVDSIEYNTDVTFTMLRINPIVEKGLFNKFNSRAYAVSDKVKVTVKKGTELVKEGEYGVGSQYGENDAISFKIRMSLPIGTGYEMTIESFNNNNSTIVPTVIGKSELFDITDGNIKKLFITMKPHNPDILTLGEEVSLTPGVYSELHIYEGDSVGAEYWYKFTAKSNYTFISNENFLVQLHGNTFPIPASEIIVFDSSGKIVESMGEDKSGTVFKSQVNMEYFFCVLPRAVNIGTHIYKQDSIKILVSNYVDTNNSIASATEINTGYNGGFFTKSSDEDFYRIYLESGNYIIESSNEEVSILDGPQTSHGMSIDIMSEAGSIISSLPNTIDGVVNIATSGFYYLKLSSNNSSIDAFDGYEFKIEKFVDNNVLIPSPSWQDYDTGINSESIYYSINIDHSKEYIISFRTEDSNDLYTSYISFRMFALVKDEANNIFKKEIINEHFDLTREEILMIPSSVTKVYLEANIMANGTYAIKLDETSPVVTPISLLEESVSNVADGMYQYYSLDVTPGQRLVINTYTRTHPELSTSSLYLGDALFHLYDIDKNKYYYRNHSNIVNGMFTVDPGVTKLILMVAHSNTYPGTVGFSIKESPPIL